MDYYIKFFKFKNNLEIIKISFLLHSDIGKTNLITRFCHHVYLQPKVNEHDDHVKNLVIDYKKYSIKICDTKDFLLQTLNYRNFILNNIDGLVICCELLNPSIKTTILKYLDEIKQHIGTEGLKNLPITIAVTKSDIKYSEIDQKLIVDQLANISCETDLSSVLFCSAKTNVGVSETFQELIKNIIKSKEENRMNRKDSSSKCNLI